MLPRTTLPRAFLSGSGKMKGAAFITVRHPTPSGRGCRAGRPHAARRNTRPPGSPHMRCRAMAWPSVAVPRRRLTGVNKHAPVPTRPGRSMGSSATLEGTKGTGAGVP
eukprot:2051111-Pleurochrysis_carterae.AAC.2